MLGRAVAPTRCRKACAAGATVTLLIRFSLEDSCRRCRRPQVDAVQAEFAATTIVEPGPERETDAAEGQRVPRNLGFEKQARFERLGADSELPSIRRAV